MKVRTTMRPHEEIDVGDAEYKDLERQGLLVKDPKTEAPKATKKED